MKKWLFVFLGSLLLLTMGSAYGQPPVDTTTQLNLFLRDLRAGFIGTTQSTGFLAKAGTAAAPGFGFAAQTGLGVYRSAANKIAFANDAYSTTPNMALSTGGLVLAGTAQGYGFAPLADANTSQDTQITRAGVGQFGWTAVLFANLGTPANGSFCYCSDCTIANPCASGGSGALAKRLNSVWVCN